MLYLTRHRDAQRTYDCVFSRFPYLNAQDSDVRRILHDPTLLDAESSWWFLIHADEEDGCIFGTSWLTDREVQAYSQTHKLSQYRLLDDEDSMVAEVKTTYLIRKTTINEMATKILKQMPKPVVSSIDIDILFNGFEDDNDDKTYFCIVCGAVTGSIFYRGWITQEQKDKLEDGSWGDVSVITCL